MDYEKILRALLSKAFKLDQGQIDELLAKETDGTDGKKVAVTADELENKILTADKTRIATITKPKDGQTFQDGYKKAKAEVLTDFEKSVREKYGLDTEVTGIELIDALVDEKSKGAAKKEITDDDVKKHPVYQNMEKQMKKSVADTKTEYEGKLTQKDNEFNRTKTLSQVQNLAWESVVKLNPILSKNAAVAQTAKNNFLKSLEGYDYEIQESGPVIMKDGKVVDDGHGNSLAFSDLVKSTAQNHFEFSNNNGGVNGGNDNNQHKGADNIGAYPAGINKPGTMADYAKIVNDETIPLADRQTVAKVWDTEHSNV
jgi:hypothetical protein